MVPPSDLLLELGGRVDRGIHLTPERILRCAQSRHNLPERHCAHNENIDVAPDIGRTLGYRAIHERYVNPLGHISQGITQNVNHPHRLDHQPAQLVEDRASLVGLVVHLGTFNPSDQNTYLSQAR